MRLKSFPSPSHPSNNQVKQPTKLSPHNNQSHTTKFQCAEHTNNAQLVVRPSGPSVAVRQLSSTPSPAVFFNHRNSVDTKHNTESVLPPIVSRLDKSNNNHNQHQPRQVCVDFRPIDSARVLFSNNIQVRTRYIHNI